MVVVDNGSTDGTAELLADEFPEVSLLELGENLGFGRAINRAVAAHPADPLILLNNDVECEAGFTEAMLDAQVRDEPAMVAGVLLREAEPNLIDSAGVVADRALMGFDYLHGRSVEVLPTAPAPLGPTGGAGLYRLAAFRAVGGFDERIFLYYEDLDLALRVNAGGGRCELAPEARAVHAYSASLGAGSGGKYAHTGWSRGYMLRRYGVLRRPGTALRALAAEATICAGQLVKDRTGKGAVGRLRGWRAAAGLERREADERALLEISLPAALALRRGRRG